MQKVKVTTGPLLREPRLKSLAPCHGFVITKRAEGIELIANIPMEVGAQGMHPTKADFAWFGRGATGTKRARCR